METDQQPHLGFTQKALPSAEPPTLALPFPTCPRSCSRPESWKGWMGLTRLVEPLLLLCVSCSLPLGGGGRRAGVQGENGKLGHGRRSSQGRRVVGPVGWFTAGRRSRGTLLSLRALPTCSENKPVLSFKIKKKKERIYNPFQGHCPVARI